MHSDRQERVIAEKGDDTGKRNGARRNNGSDAGQLKVWTKGEITDATNVEV